MILALALAATDLPPMVEIAPDVWSTNASLGSTKPVPPKDRQCVRFWRPVYYAAQAADIATTVAAIESGKGTEANPAIRAVFGKRPKFYELAAFKAAYFGFNEFMAQRALKRGGHFPMATFTSNGGSVVDY